MDDERIYAAACAHVGADPRRVMKRRIEAEAVVIIVNNGIKGCPKYVVPFSDLPALDDEPAGGGVLAEKLAEAVSGDVVTLNEDIVYITDDVTLPDGVHLRGAETGRQTRLYDATPAAIVLADKHGIDLATATGTGVGGRITKRDVESLTLARGAE